MQRNYGFKIYQLLLVGMNRVWKAAEGWFISDRTTVIFVDCGGLSPSLLLSAACCRNRTPATRLERQRQTGPVDFPGFGCKQAPTRPPETLRCSTVGPQVFQWTPDFITLIRPNQTIYQTKGMKMARTPESSNIRNRAAERTFLNSRQIPSWPVSVARWQQQPSSQGCAGASVSVAPKRNCVLAFLPLRFRGRLRWGRCSLTVCVIWDPVLIRRTIAL